MRQRELEFALNDRSPGHQRVKKFNVRLVILSIGWCDGTTHQEYEPNSGKAHSFLPRLCCLVSASLSHDATLGGLLVKVPNEFVGARFQGGHFKLEGFAASNDLFDTERGQFKFLVLGVLVDNDQDERRVGLDAEFFRTKAVLV